VSCSRTVPGAPASLRWRAMAPVDRCEQGAVTLGVDEQDLRRPGNTAADAPGAWPTEHPGAAHRSGLCRAREWASATWRTEYRQDAPPPVDSPRRPLAIGRRGSAAIRQQVTVAVVSTARTVGEKLTRFRGLPTAVRAPPAPFRPASSHFWPTPTDPAERRRTRL
jgi:hypothetical protein